MDNANETLVPEVQDDTIVTYVSTYDSTTLEEDLKSFDQTYGRTADLRQQIIDKLTPVVLKININTEVCDRDSASALDSQMNVIKTFSDLLNDSDKAIKSRVDMKTKQKESADGTQTMMAFVESLRQAHKARANRTASAMATIDDQLEQRVAEEAIIISEGELRDDSTDLS